MKFSGHYVKRVLHYVLNLNENAGGHAFWLVEFKGPDGLRYVATYFGDGRCAIVCCAAPMRQDLLLRAYEEEIALFVRMVIDSAQRANGEPEEREAPSEDPSEDPGEDLIEGEA